MYRILGLNKASSGAPVDLESSRRIELHSNDALAQHTSPAAFRMVCTCRSAQCARAQNSWFIQHNWLRDSGKLSYSAAVHTRPTSIRSRSILDQVAPGATEPIGQRTAAV
ncbi:hypothetical protein CC79DRAFT_192022 [Sarocladium strictum]